MNYAVCEIDGTNYLSALVNRNPRALGQAHAEYSGVLDAWDPAQTAGKTDDGMILVRDRTPADQATRRFMRLQGGWWITSRPFPGCGTTRHRPRRGGGRRGSN